MLIFLPKCNVLCALNNSHVLFFTLFLQHPKVQKVYLGVPSRKFTLEFPPESLPWSSLQMVLTNWRAFILRVDIPANTLQKDINVSYVQRDILHSIKLITKILSLVFCSVKFEDLCTCISLYSCLIESVIFWKNVLVKLSWCLVMIVFNMILKKVLIDDNIDIDRNTSVRMYGLLPLCRFGFPKQLSRSGIIALCVDTDNKRIGQTWETYVNAQQLSVSLLPLLLLPSLQSHLPAAALVRVQPQPGEVALKFVGRRGPFWNKSIIYPPKTQIWFSHIALQIITRPL